MRCGFEFFSGCGSLPFGVLVHAGFVVAVDERRVFLWFCSFFFTLFEVLVFVEDGIVCVWPFVLQCPSSPFCPLFLFVSLLVGAL